MAEYMHVRGISNDKILQSDSVFRSTSFMKAHPTVAFFTSSPGGAFTFEKWQMWRGIAEVVQEQGMNLLYVAGEEFEYSPQAVLYDLVGKHNVDGIILWNSFFSPRSTIEKTQEFVARFPGLPIVSIELPLKGACNLMIDNYQGMRDILAHLVEAHGYRRIAFLNQADSYSSRLRQHAFEHILMEYGSYDPALVGNLEELDARGMRPGVDYQAMVAHADSLAVTTVDELQARGVRIPDDVAVTGFNDGLEARGLLPPLTTVRLPFRKLGREAVEILVQRIGGQKPDVQMVMPVQLILRRSCGCLEPLAEGAVSAVSIRSTDKTLGDALAHQRSEIIAEMAVSMGAPNDNLSNSWAEGLFDSFSDELNRLSKCCTRSSSQDYLMKMNLLLHQAVEEGVNVSRWHDALSALRRHLRPYLNGEDLSYAEDLWQQARVLIGQSAIRGEVHRNWKTSQRAEQIRALEAGMMTSVDFNELLEVLSSGLPRLGINNFCLVLYEDQFQPDGWVRLILALKDGKRIQIDAEKQRFQPKDILLHNLLCQTGPCCLVVEALHIREEQLGYMVFQNGPPPDAYNCEIYQALHIQLSNAIKEVRLRQKLQDALQQAEEANLLKSRFLSMVSHELRTPINLIVGLSEMAMRQQTQDRKASLDVLKKFNEQIYISGQHLDRLIRDVLDLASSQAGQMNLICAPLDLSPLLQDAICIGNQLAEQKSLQFRSNIPEAIPQVCGDKTRLRQILLNLINNAVKFTAHGEIRLTVKVESSEILISVEDTGLGIAKEEQESIFDEFHQSDRTAVRGYGGIGLGLAITRRLVEMHGGRIWVTSHGWEGSGSNFCFTLPVMQTVEAAPGAAVDAAQGASPQAEEEDTKDINGNDRQEIVMVLTKTSGSAESLIARLVQHGFAVQEMALEDNPNFYEELVASPPGAVILDMAPASEQGWEIMKKLKEVPSTQDVPVLFYSLLANEDSGSVFEMDFLTKPVGADHLMQALKGYGMNSNRKSTKTILMIDDEPGMLDLHARMVKSAISACRIQTAQSGIQGLQMMRKEQPDLVLLDLMMPELDGFGVLKAMQEEQMLRNIPVIILSAQVLTRREIDRLNQRVAAVLGKGLFSAKETITRIEYALSRNKRLGSESQRLVHHGMAYIHEHFREPISRVDIANYLSVNEQYLSRCFNKEIGIGPMAYLGRYRIQQAKRLLEIGTMSITQVALEVGFSSQSYFSRIFQQETGITPTDYQNGARPPQE